MAVRNTNNLVAIMRSKIRNVPVLNFLWQPAIVVVHRHVNKGRKTVAVEQGTPATLRQIGTALVKRKEKVVDTIATDHGKSSTTSLKKDTSVRTYLFLAAWISTSLYIFCVYRCNNNPLSRHTTIRYHV